MLWDGVGLDWGFGSYVSLELWDKALEGVLLAADTPKALVKPVKCAEAFEVDCETDLTVKIVTNARF